MKFYVVFLVAKPAPSFQLQEPVPESDAENQLPEHMEETEVVPETTVLKINTPITPDVIHPREEIKNKLDFPFKSSRAFLSRLAAGELHRKSLESISTRVGRGKQPPLKTVLSYQASEGPLRRQPLIDATQKRDAVRYVSPWRKDPSGPLMSTRAKTFTSIPTSNPNMKPVLRREKTDLPTYGGGKHRLAGSLHPVLRTDSSVYPPSPRRSPDRLSKRSPDRSSVGKPWTSELDFRDKPQQTNNDLIASASGIRVKNLRKSEPAFLTSSSSKTSASSRRSHQSETYEEAKGPTSNYQILHLYDKGMKDPDRGRHIFFRNAWEKPQTDSARVALHNKPLTSPRKSRGTDKQVRYAMDVQIIS